MSGIVILNLLLMFLETVLTLEACVHAEGFWRVIAWIFSCIYFIEAVLKIALEGWNKYFSQIQNRLYG